MTLELGASLRVRALVYVAGERIPFFWPMRGFIHHNPLHGFEHMPFEQAVEAGAGTIMSPWAHCTVPLPVLRRDTNTFSISR